MAVLSPVPRRRRRQLAKPPYAAFEPADVIWTAQDASAEMPGVMDFVRSETYLNISSIYPRQATLLKLMFLARDEMTDYDRDVLNEWAQGFRLSNVKTGGGVDGGISSVLRYDGQWGIPPDWEERMEQCIAEGRPWFREFLAVIGRRGSKGFIGGVAMARVLWAYILLGDPHKRFGVHRDRRLTIFVFAGKKEQAKRNQWADIVNVILGAPCFRGYLADVNANRLALYSRADYGRWERLREVVGADYDYSTFEVLPMESTITAGRGPASFAQAYDEMAFVDRQTARASAGEVYSGATPSLDTFGSMAFLYEGSSPWQMIGQFYDNWCQALAVDPATHEAMRPDMMVAQLESWDLYRDWEIAHELPDGRRSKDDDPVCFEELPGAIQEYDEQMERLDRANPERFAVERRAHWASVQDAYLNPQRIEEQFSRPFDDGVLRVDMPRGQSSVGRLDWHYEMHVDPSKSNDATGMAVAHITEPDASGLHHVVIDRLYAWLPAEFPDHQIDYLSVADELQDVLSSFLPNTLTFDQFGSPFLLQTLGQWTRSAGLPKRVSVREQIADQKLNWRMAECFKTALGMHLIHAPRHDLYEMECKFLMMTGAMRVDHPSSGPVKSKDVWDAVANVVWRLIGKQMMSLLFENVQVSGSHQPPVSSMPVGDSQIAASFPRPMGRAGFGTPHPRGGSGRR